MLLSDALRASASAFSGADDRVGRQRLREELITALARETTLSETRPFVTNQSTELQALLKDGTAHLLRRALGKLPFGADIAAAFEGLQLLYRNHTELQSQLQAFMVKALLFQLDLADAVESGAVGGGDDLELAQRERIMICLRECHDLARRASQYQPGVRAAAMRVVLAGERLDELHHYEKQLADHVAWYTTRMGFKNAEVLRGVNVEVKQLSTEFKQISEKMHGLVRDDTRRVGLTLCSRFRWGARRRTPMHMHAYPQGLQPRRVPRQGDGYG